MQFLASTKGRCNLEKTNMQLPDGNGMRGPHKLLDPVEAKFDDTLVQFLLSYEFLENTETYNEQDYTNDATSDAVTKCQSNPQVIAGNAVDACSVCSFSNDSSCK